MQEVTFVTHFQSWTAISITLLAGLTTALGGLVVYFKRLVKLANKTFLSAALGFAAGIYQFVVCDV